MPTITAISSATSGVPRMSKTCRSGFVLVVDEDVDERLAQHQRDRQQDAEEGDAERTAVGAIAGARLLVGERVGVEGVRRVDARPSARPAVPNSGPASNDRGHRHRDTREPT